MEEKRYTVFNIAIKNKDMESFEKKLGLIQKYICAERDIPYLLVERLWSLVGTEYSLEKQYDSQKSVEITTRAAEYFSKQKDYDFEKKANMLAIPEPFSRLGQAKETPTTVKNRYVSYTVYSLEEMCLYALRENDRSKRATDNKGVVSRRLYNCICDYSKRFSKKHQELLTDYKKGVITAFLINELGFIVPKIEPRNPKLFDKIKKDIKQIRATDKQ